MENLYNLVSKTTTSESKQSKVQIGYTVDTYKGVLAALQQAQADVAAKASGGGSGAAGTSVTKNPIFKRWTELSAINVNVDSIVDGFVMDSNRNPETYRQQQCILLPYMSFMVTLPDEKGTKVPYYAPWKANRGSLDCGNSTRAKNTFPIPVMTKEYCDSAGLALGSPSNPWEIGIGVDLGDNGTPEAFFERCYKEIYVRGMAKKLAEKGALLAEIAFPNGGQALTIHVKVTADSGKSEQGKAHVVYFPFPLLLLNDFALLGKVQVNNGEYKTVGSGDCTYPFASSKFNHLTASIDDFTPSYVKDVVQKPGRVLATKEAVLYQFNGATHDFATNACYIRFYLDKSKEVEISNILGKEIPDVYKTEIFKGRGEAKMGSEIVGWEDVYSGSSSVGTVDAGEVAEFWEQIGKMLKNPLSGEDVARAINQAGKWESGGDWGMWEVCGSGDGDGEGVSAGKFQFTQRAGGIKVYKDMFLARGGQMSVGFQQAIDNAKTGSKSKISRAEAEGLLAFKKEFADQAATKEGKLAQCDVWKKEKGDITIECYNMLGCTTAAEFSSIFSAVNHHPIIKKDYQKWMSIIQSKENGIEKVRAIENAHWAAVANYYYKRNATPENVDASFIRGLSSNFGNGWANRYNDSLNAYRSMC